MFIGDWCVRIDSLRSHITLFLRCSDTLQFVPGSIHALAYPQNYDAWRMLFDGGSGIKVWDHLSVDWLYQPINHTNQNSFHLGGEAVSLANTSRCHRQASKLCARYNGGSRPMESRAFLFPRDFNQFLQPLTGPRNRGVGQENTHTHRVVMKSR